MDEIDFYIELALQPTDRVLRKFMEKCRRYNYQSVDHLLRDLSPDLSSITQLDVAIPIEIGQRLLQEPTFLPHVEEFLTYAAHHPINLAEYRTRGITNEIIRAFLCKMIIVNQCNIVELFVRKHVTLDNEDLLSYVHRCAVINGRIDLVHFLELFDTRLDSWAHLSVASELNQIDMIKDIITRSGIKSSTTLTEDQAVRMMSAWSSVQTKEAFDFFESLGISVEQLRDISSNSIYYRPYYRPYYELPNRRDLSKNKLYESALANLNYEAIRSHMTTLLLPAPAQLLAKIHPHRITRIDPPRLLPSN
jgi:hypothetical protein